MLVVIDTFPHMLKLKSPQYRVMVTIDQILTYIQTHSYIVTHTQLLFFQLSLTKMMTKPCMLIYSLINHHFTTGEKER